MMTGLIATLAGLVSLYFGAELLVRGAVSLGLRLGVSPLIVGLTIVAFGTSAPELAVSVKAALSGKTDVAVANVVGSNIANIGLILGLAILLRPVRIDIKLIRIDTPIMIAVTLVLCLFMLNGVISRFDGAILFIGIIVYTVFNIVLARRARAQTQQIISVELPAVHDSVPKSVVMIAVGLVILVLGGGWLVDGAVAIARFLGVSNAVIGLTVVAVGTSLPELATSLLAAAKKHGDIAVGNIIGSNIFNILCVLGTSALVAPLPKGQIGWPDLGVMLVFSLALLPLMRSDFLLKRWEGTAFVAAYLAYLIWLGVTAG